MGLANPFTVYYERYTNDDNRYGIWTGLGFK